MDQAVRLIRAAVAVIWLLIPALAFGRNAGEVYFSDPVTISQADIDWFRKSRVGWIDAENGAPIIVSPGLTLESHWLMLEGEDKGMLVRFERVFLAFAVYATLGADKYPVPQDCVMTPMPGEVGVPAFFELTETHRMAINFAWWRHAFIDPKYPYGSYHYYQADMAERFGRVVPVDADGLFQLPESDERFYEKTHRELVFALCAFVRFSELTPGAYRLPLDGWEGFASVRLFPPSKRQISEYLAETGRLLLLNLLPYDSTDFVIEWLKANSKFAEIRQDPD